MKASTSMRRLLSLATASGLAGIMWATWGAPASAGTLQVNPVLVEITTARRTASVTIRNEEAVPVTIRTYALAWNQANGQDNYEETTDVIVSPPVTTIAPGASQLVRVGLRAPANGPRAYRLIVEEVPEANPGGGIRVALRLNLPFYIQTAAGDVAQLRWSAQRYPDGGWSFEASNPGVGYARLSPDAARAATGVRFDDSIHFGTVLPGSTRRWRIGGNLRVEDAGRLQQIQGTATGVAAVQDRN